jgi:general stress protein 26
MSPSKIFPLPLLSKLKRNIQHKQHSRAIQFKEDNKKWAIFTYSSTLIWKVTNIFRDTNLSITYMYRNTLQHLLNPTKTTICTLKEKWCLLT